MSKQEAKERVLKTTLRRDLKNLLIPNRDFFSWELFRIMFLGLSKKDKNKSAKIIYNSIYPIYNEGVFIGYGDR